jgi:capsular polysaccharide export protein
MAKPTSFAAAEPLYVFSGGFLLPSALPRRVNRILTLAGHPPRFGLPGPTDRIGVWGHSPRAARGEKMAKRTGASLMRVEDAFLRSIRPGRSGEPPLGLLIDKSGVHYDPKFASGLETLLATHPLDDGALLARARIGAARLRALDLSKYNAHDPDIAPPAPGYVLVIDQVRGDASLRHGGLDSPLPHNIFREMLIHAQADHPGTRIVIKTHPDTQHGHRQGHFGLVDAVGRISLVSEPVSPWALLDGAIAVYTVSSQLGFEAIFAGHKPRVFGMPFYAGWGLSQDEVPHPRRRRVLTRAQLFAATMLLYPTWYDPSADALCDFETVVNHLEAQVRGFRDDHHGHVALGMRLWKRGYLQRFFGRDTPIVFAKNADDALTKASALSRDVLVWAGAETPDLPNKAAQAGVALRRVEDGFLRSKGLGAELVPALSLVCDSLGIYYDPTRPSQLETLIQTPPPPGAQVRADALVTALLRARLSKYNLGGATPILPEGHRILVPGQVEDDASIRLGAGDVVTNLGLLQAVRTANPDAVILYKPHPDVEAGLRKGAVTDAEMAGLADAVMRRADPIALLAEVQEVWTITSLLGFEALLRGVPVTTLGAPFYAGWGLTRDLGPVPARRKTGPRPELWQLAHATLIAYPRYIDPFTAAPCPPETVVARLRDAGTVGQSGLGLRLLSKLQGSVASYASWWR